jgi:hypothetical protein
MINLISWIASSVVFASIIMMGALGETLTEKSGHLNLGVPWHYVYQRLLELLCRLLL